MIQSYISIGLKSGLKVQYVRDVVTDTNGIGEKYYGYSGAGYQDLGIPDKIVKSLVNLVNGETYYFKLDIDGDGPKEYSITPTRTKSSLYQSPYISSNSNETMRGFDKLDIIKLLNAATLSDGARWYATPHGDIRCQSTGVTKNTSIALFSGVTGKDLLASLDADLQIAVPGDQLVDQDGVGQVLGDYNTILSNIEAEAQETDPAALSVFLEFPESGGDTPMLIRKNSNESYGQTGKIVTQVPINAISEVTIVEKQIAL